MSINLFDSVTLASEPKITHDGYLVATARIARTGIQDYAGHELGMPDRNVVRLYRPEEEVFSDASMSTIAYRPMTNEHPDSAVTAANWRELSIGQIGAEVARDGEYIRVPLVLMDATAIDDYKSGKCELSLGYRSKIDWTAGITADGEPYDAIQRKIRVNHLALVDKARAGSEARIGDNGGRKQPKTREVSKMTVKVIHDGITIEVSEQAAEVIAELNKRLVKAQAEAEAAQSEAEVAAQDAAKKDAEIDALKDAQMTDAMLDDAIAERVALVSQAKKLVDQDYSGSPAEIKKQALTALIGDSMADKEEAYIDARFDIELEKLDNDTRDHKDDKTIKDADARYRERQANAWRAK